jgi:hypothetical protein
MPYIIFAVSVLKIITIMLPYIKLDYYFWLSSSNLANVLKCFLIKSVSLIGQTSVFRIVDIRLSFA